MAVSMSKKMKILAIGSTTKFDDFMLDICQCDATERGEPIVFRKNEYLLQEINKLQKKATGGAQYQYQRTLAFVVNGEDEPQNPVCEKYEPRPPPKIVLSEILRDNNEEEEKSNELSGGSGEENEISVGFNGENGGDEDEDDIKNEEDLFY
jgi:hypothetical protein